MFFWLTWAATQLSAAPTIGAIANATGYQAKLAPSAVFVIFGAELGPASIVTTPAPAYPTTLAGTSILLMPQTGGGPAIPARVVYTSATQVAGLMPSSIAPGTYMASVTYNGVASQPKDVTVVARSFGIATANSQGTGPAQVTIGNVNDGISLVRLSSGQTTFNGYDWTLTPAHPGDTLVIWGTGGGADASYETGATPVDETAAGNFRVLVGGRELTPLYSGASAGYPGLWQVNFQLPPDIATNCFAALQVRTGSEWSNTATMAIAPPGQNACSSDMYDAGTLAKLDAGQGLTGGGFSIGRTTATNSFLLRDGTRTPVTTNTVETAQGAVSVYSAAAIAEIHSAVVIGECRIWRKTAPQTRIGIGIPDSFLDAGALLPLTGPRVPAATSIQRIQGTQLYSVQLPLSTVGPGTYTITGNGGPDVAAFTRAIEIPADFNPTNLASLASVTRGQPLTMTWTGGGTGEVHVNGTFWSTVSGSDADAATWILDATTIDCAVPASRGSYTVPASVMSMLPPDSPDLRSGNHSYITVTVSAPTAQSFYRFPLVGGGQTDFGSVNYSIGATKNVPVN
jgi:uncharacterized protein (TIGR03437 family)